MIDSPTLTLTETQQRALDNLPPRVAEALSHFRDNLLARFSDQIRRIILYGSFARGEAHEESDVGFILIYSPTSTTPCSMPRKRPCSRQV